MAGPFFLVRVGRLEEKMERRFFLGVDTSTMWLNVSLVTSAGEVAGEFHERVGTHTSHLLPVIDQLLQEGGRKRADLAAVGAVLGPGSFTGLRVGLASVMGLCSALDIPAFGMDTLTALALSCRHDGEGLAVLDARRSEVYVRRFRKDGEDVTPLDEARSSAPESVLTGPWTPAWAIGDGVGLVLRWPVTCTTIPEIPNLGVQAAFHARSRLEQDLDGEVLSPVYVRDPDVRKSASYRP